MRCGGQSAPRDWVALPGVPNWLIRAGGGQCRPNTVRRSRRGARRATLLYPQRRDEHIAEVGARLYEALRLSTVMLFTSRALRQGSDGDDSLAISRSVSSVVVEVVRAALPARPGWVMAMGGITSNDVAVHGPGIRGRRSSDNSHPEWCPCSRP